MVLRAVGAGLGLGVGETVGMGKHVVVWIIVGNTVGICVIVGTWVHVGTCVDVGTCVMVGKYVGSCVGMQMGVGCGVDSLIMGVDLRLDPGDCPLDTVCLTDKPRNPTGLTGILPRAKRTFASPCWAF